MVSANYFHISRAVLHYLRAFRQVTGNRRPMTIFELDESQPDDSLVLQSRTDRYGIALARGALDRVHLGDVAPVTPEGPLHQPLAMTAGAGHVDLLVGVLAHLPSFRPLLGALPAPEDRRAVRGHEGRRRLVALLGG